MKPLSLIPAMLFLGVWAAISHAAPAGPAPASSPPPKSGLNSQAAAKGAAPAQPGPTKAAPAPRQPAAPKGGAPAAVPAPAPAFVRFITGEESDKLQTAIVCFESPKGVRVDLVGAIHIGDKAYFDALNQRFKRYDAVLYELVGPPIHGTDKEAEAKRLKDRERLAWIGHLQTKIRDTLQLQGQLDCIDYKAKNFVHADMDTSQFTATQEEKKESFLSLYFRAAMAQKEVNAKNGTDSEIAGMVMLLKLLTAKDGSVGLKRMLAQQFESVGDIMAGIESGNGTVIVGERNRVALEVMDKEIASGKKHLAIFYGAAHLGDMEKRLKAKGYKRVKTEWMTAWDMPHEE